MPAMVAYKVDK